MALGDDVRLPVSLRGFVTMEPWQHRSSPSEEVAVHLSLEACGAPPRPKQHGVPHDCLSVSVLDLDRAAQHRALHWLSSGKDSQRGEHDALVCAAICDYDLWVERCGECASLLHHTIQSAAVPEAGAGGECAIERASTTPAGRSSGGSG
jgi:hypothetical protein